MKINLRSWYENVKPKHLSDTFNASYKMLTKFGKTSSCPKLVFSVTSTGIMSHAFRVTKDIPYTLL